MASPSSTAVPPAGNKQELVVAVSFTLLALSLIAISLRMYARVAVLRKTFFDDVLMLLGAVTASVLSVCLVVAAYNGFGKHTAELSSGRLELLRKLAFTILCFYIATAILVKTSYLVLYLRLSNRTVVRTLFYFLMFLVWTQNITFFVVQSLSCIPLSFKPTTNEDNDRRCWSTEIVQLSYNINGTIAVCLDLALFSIPLYMLHGMELPTRQKLAVGVLFALGFLPIGAGAMRCYYTWFAIDSKDVFYDLVEGAIFAQVEMHLAILAGSASTFKVLLRGLSPSCCHGEETPFDTFDELHQRASELPTPWPTEVLKLSLGSSAESSPVDTEAGLRRWTAPERLTVDKGWLRPKTINVRRLSAMILQRTPGPVQLPAEVQLRFPSIESRLLTQKTWLREMSGAKSLDGGRQSLMQPHAM